MLTYFCQQALFTGISIYSLLIANSPTIICQPPKELETDKTQTINTNNAVNPTIQTFRGLLTYNPIPPVRSERAYKGEEFFLKTSSVNEETIVLRPSDKVSHTDLESFHNQQVEITAVYFAGIRPSKNEVACPLDVDGQCIVQSAGYQVLSITPLKFNRK